MRRWIAKLASIAAITIGMMGGGCLYTQQAKVMSPVVIPFKGEYRVDQSLLDHPPQTVAVLPSSSRAPVAASSRRPP
jgi:hypothetical protein